MGEPCYFLCREFTGLIDFGGRKKGGGRGRLLADKDPVAGLFIQLLHLQPMRFSLLREFFGEGAVAPRIRFVALRETLSHLLAFFARGRAERDVVLVVLVGLI